MLYFSKIKLLVIYFVIICLTFFFTLNFIQNDNTFLSSKKINLGLDLRGGSYLLLEIDTKPIQNQKLQSKLLEIRKELKKENIKYNNLKIIKNKIIFSSSQSDIDIFLNILANKNNSFNAYYDKYRSFELDYLIDNDKLNIFFSKYGLIEIKSAAQEQSLEIVRRRIDETGTKEPTIIKNGVDRILIELPGLSEPSRIKNLLGKTANLTFKFISDSDEESSFGVESIFSDETKEMVKVDKRVILSGDNLIDAQPKFDNRNNETIVTFNLDRVGAKRFGIATTSNIGKYLAIILDDKIISAPQIRESILGGAGQISGNFTFQSATDLALLLRSGALPAPLNIIEERTVGPGLGEDSIRAGTISLIIGFTLVIIFMVLRYKFLGLIADLALIINLFLLLGVLTLLEATLTLPGIAGIILTVGMAVDGNVLIYERIKEEAKTEKSIIHAFDVGYKKAQSAVFDANITTLIATIILFFLGSGPVKGFAVTLGVGILSTLFSVFLFARHLSSVYARFNKNKNFVI